jgi:hypothetical protein
MSDSCPPVGLLVLGGDLAENQEALPCSLALDVVGYDSVSGMAMAIAMCT